MTESARAQLVGAILEHVASLGREFAGVKVRPFGEVRLSRSQLDVLFLLAHSRTETTPGRLATMLGVTAGAVSQIVDSLRDRGLVESSAHPRDGRTRVITLTPSARGTVDAFEQEVVERLSPRFDALGDDDLDQLEELLRTVREAR